MSMNDQTESCCWFAPIKSQKKEKKIQIYINERIILVHLFKTHIQQI